MGTLANMAALCALLSFAVATRAESLVEWCSGADDDGDGEVDEGFECVRGSEEPCDTSCGSRGTRVCSVACTWGACAPPGERCNGRDDDCDGEVDEDFDCVAEQRGLCPLPGGELGMGECGGDCRWSRCVAFAGEICNGLDDNRDGAADEEFECAVGATVGCGEGGAVRRCKTTCRWGPCEGVEVCNLLDDNGDGRVDEGLAYVMVAGGEVEAAGQPRLLATAACAPGRIAVASFAAIAYWVEVIGSDGRRLAAPFRVCQDAAELKSVKVEWLGDHIAVACQVRVDEEASALEVGVFEVGGRRRGQAVRLPNHHRWAPFDLLAGPGGLYVAYTVGAADDAWVWLQVYDDMMRPTRPAVPIRDPPHSGQVRLQFDERGLVLFAGRVRDDGYRGMWIQRLAADTLQPDEGVELVPYRGAFQRPHRLGDGWAFFSLGYVYVFGADNQLLGTRLAPGGEGGLGAYRADFDGPGLASGVAGSQFVVHWPGWGGFSRYSADGRFNGSSDPWFPEGVIDPREARTGRAGCVLPDGHVAAVWGLGEPAPSFRWEETDRLFLSVVGCPDPPQRAEGR